MASVVDKMRKNAKETCVGLELAVTVLSTLVFLPLSNNTYYFGNNCLLNADIYLVKFDNMSVAIDLTKTVFGGSSDCNFTTFLNVIIAIHAVIWLAFFVHLDSFRAPNGSAVSTILPALVTHLVFFLCSIACCVKIDNGFNGMCKHLEINNFDPDVASNCEDFQKLHWDEGKSEFYTYFKISHISSILLTIVLLFMVLLIIVCLYWDFISTFYVPDPDSNESELDPKHPLDTSVSMLTISSSLCPINDAPIISGKSASQANTNRYHSSDMPVRDSSEDEVDGAAGRDAVGVISVDVHHNPDLGDKPKTRLLPGVRNRSNYGTLDES